MARRERTIAVVIVVAVFAVVVGLYTATFSFRGITDTELNSLQTRSLVLHGDVDLARYQIDPAAFQTKQEHLATRRGPHVYSVYGIGVSLMAAPAYAILVRMGASERVLQETVAIAFAAAAAVMFGLVLLRVAPPSIAMTCFIVFAFGTTLWPVASMALFQQGPVLFFECLALWGLFSRHPRSPALAGAALGIATLIRPTAFIPLAIIALFYLSQGRRRLQAFCAGAFLPLLVIVVQNRWIWGSWITGGYSHGGGRFDAPARTALPGLLFGWWRGMLIYSPALGFGFLGWVLTLRRRPHAVERILAFLGISVFTTILLYSKWADWGGGLNQFGYRLQLEVVPFVLVLAAYAMTRIRRLALFALPLVGLSVLTTTWGAAPSREGWDSVLFARRISETSLGRSWTNFFDHPMNGLARLAAVAAAALVIAVIAYPLWSERTSHVFLRPSEE